MLSDIFLSGGAIVTPTTNSAIFQLVDPIRTVFHVRYLL